MVFPTKTIALSVEIMTEFAAPYMAEVHKRYPITFKEVKKVHELPYSESSITQMIRGKKKTVRPTVRVIIKAVQASYPDADPDILEAAFLEGSDREMVIRGRSSKEEVVEEEEDNFPEELINTLFTYESLRAILSRVPLSPAQRMGLIKALLND